MEFSISLNSHLNVFEREDDMFKEKNVNSGNNV